jgi:hypothetical protein
MDEAMALVIALRAGAIEDRETFFIGVERA